MIPLKWCIICFISSYLLQIFSPNFLRHLPISVLKLCTSPSRVRFYEDSWNWQRWKIRTNLHSIREIRSNDPSIHKAYCDRTAKSIPSFVSSPMKPLSADWSECLQFRNFFDMSVRHAAYTCINPRFIPLTLHCFLIGFHSTYCVFACFI
jgi:hypothetical protein